MSTPPPRPADPRDSTLRHLVTSLLYTVVTVVALGLVYPLADLGPRGAAVSHQAQGSLIEADGKVVGSELVGQAFAQAAVLPRPPVGRGQRLRPDRDRRHEPRPDQQEADRRDQAHDRRAGEGEPGCERAQPRSDLVTSSASGIDPDISPEGAYYQAPRVAKARGLSLGAVRAQIAAHVAPRQLGILGEPRVNVLALNRALDAQGAVSRP